MLDGGIAILDSRRQYTPTFLMEVTSLSCKAVKCVCSNDATEVQMQVFVDTSHAITDPVHNMSWEELSNHSDIPVCKHTSCTSLVKQHFPGVES